MITFTYSVDEETGTIVLLYLYDKEERETVSPNEIMDLLAEMKREYDL